MPHAKLSTPECTVTLTDGEWHREILRRELLSRVFTAANRAGVFASVSTLEEYEPVGSDPEESEYYSKPLCKPEKSKYDPEEYSPDESDLEESQPEESEPETFEPEETKMQARMRAAQEMFEKRRRAEENMTYMIF